MPGIRGGQIRDETIESVDIASGSIKMGEVSPQVISSQGTIGSVDTSNDFLLIYDANNDALKKVAPTNLGIGGSGSPGGSDTQVQFNDGGSFAGNSGLTFNKTSGILTVDKGAVFNEGSHDSDFRVESNNNANMLFVNGNTDRVGIGTDAPLTTLHVSGAGSSDASITIQGQADAGIRLAADKANGDEGNNPYIDWYQDGQNPTSRNNRVAMIAMEGTAGTAFTGSLANSLFIDTFCPNSQNSNVRRFQIATDCSSSADGANHSARLTIEGSHGYVGLHTNAATSPLHVYSNESGNFAALIDNDQSSAGHVMKLTTDGTGNGSYVLDMESASSTIFRARADGRFGFGPDGVSSMGAGTFVVGIDNSSHTSDIAISQRLQHLGDSDTYMDFPSNDNITFSAGGSEELKIASDAILVKQFIKHDGDEDTLINFADNKIILKAGNIAMVTAEKKGSAPHEVTINDGSNNIDFVVKGNGSNQGNPGMKFDASTNKLGINGIGTPAYELEVAGDIGLAEYIYHRGDENTYIRFQDDDINLQAGGRSMIKMSEGSIDQVLIMSGGSGLSPNVKDSTDTNFFVSGTIGSRGTSTAGTSVFGGDVVISGTLNPGTLEIAGTEVTSTAAELNLLDASVTSEPADGVWAVVERIAKATLDSNDWPISGTPVSLGVTIPDNAILTKIVFDTTQTFAAGDNGSADMSVVDFGLYNGNTQVIQFASQTMIGRAGAGGGDKPYSVGVTEIFPITAGLSAKLTADLTVKFHNIDDGSGMMNNLDAGALDVFIYYIMGA